MVVADLCRLNCLCFCLPLSDHLDAADVVEDESRGAYQLIWLAPGVEMAELCSRADYDPGAEVYF